jgi:hypothetical protein
MPDQPPLPFRWNVARREQLGSLLDGYPALRPWFLPQLLEAGGKLLARSGDGDLCFVGRSADPFFDLLSGAPEGTSWSGRLRSLPASVRFHRHNELASSPALLAQWRAIMASAGIEPAALARRRRPFVLVDLVASGGTFAFLVESIRAWTADAGGQWDVVRAKLHLLGITRRTKTSPKTFRWHRDVDALDAIPPGARVSVSLDRLVWVDFAEVQPKMTGAFTRERWLDEARPEPRRGERALHALAMAVALYDVGRSRGGREQLAKVMAREPAMRERWLRSLVLELKSPLKQP